MKNAYGRQYKNCLFFPLHMLIKTHNMLDFVI